MFLPSTSIIKSVKFKALPSLSTYLKGAMICAGNITLLPSSSTPGRIGKSPFSAS